MRVDAEGGSLVLLVEPASGSALCPLCRTGSAKTHSRYARTVADLPWRGAAVGLKVRSRKFFCGNRRCPRRIFRERLPDVAAHARKTVRLEEVLLSIAVELGGEAEARLAHELLDEGTFEAACMEGRALALDEAVAYALT